MKLWKNCGWKKIWSTTPYVLEISSWTKCDKKNHLKENYKGFNPSEIVKMFKDVGDINVDLHYGENNSPPPHYNPQLSQIGVQQIDNIKFLE